MQAAEEDDAHLGWFSKLTKDSVNTHPASPKRIQAMENWLAEAQAIRAASPACAKGLENHFSRFWDEVRHVVGW